MGLIHFSDECSLQWGSNKLVETVPSAADSKFSLTSRDKAALTSIVSQSKLFRKMLDQRTSGSKKSKSGKSQVKRLRNMLLKLSERILVFKTNIMVPLITIADPESLDGFFSNHLPDSVPEPVRKKLKKCKTAKDLMDFFIRPELTDLRRHERLISLYPTTIPKDMKGFPPNVEGRKEAGRKFDSAEIVREPPTRRQLGGFPSYAKEGPPLSGIKRCHEASL